MQVHVAALLNAAGRTAHRYTIMLMEATLKQAYTATLYDMAGTVLYKNIQTCVPRLLSSGTEVILNNRGGVFSLQSVPPLLLLLPLISLPVFTVWVDNKC